jgi:short-subunit dehydrogenase
VVVSSIAPYAPLPFHSLYTAHKGGLLSACRSLSQELRPSGIAVSCVLPGTVWSEMMSPSLRDALATAGMKVEPMPTAHAVHLMLRGMQAERDEVRVWAASEYVLAFLYRVAPRLVERLIAPNAPALREVMKRMRPSP